MIKIIDASVAIKWFVHEEPGKKKALAILDELKDAPQSFAVPELFFSEMLAIFCRLMSDSNLITGYLRILQDLGWSRIGHGRQLLEVAVGLAKEHAISGYDAIYVASAKLTEGLWITADDRACKKIRRLGLSLLISS